MELTLQGPIGCSSGTSSDSSAAGPPQLTPPAGLLGAEQQADEDKGSEQAVGSAQVEKLQHAGMLQLAAATGEPAELEGMQHAGMLQPAELLWPADLEETQHADVLQPVELLGIKCAQSCPAGNLESALSWHAGAEKGRWRVLTACTSSAARPVGSHCRPQLFLDMRK